MRNPADLSREELEQVVAEVRDALYLSVVDAMASLDPDKCWDADTCQEVADTLIRHGLAPTVVKCMEND